MSTPTRGPWRVSEVSCSVMAPSAAKDANGEPHYWRIVAEVPQQGPSPHDVRMRHAAAHLIAAAPDLADALADLERAATAMYRAAAPHGNWGKTDNRFADQETAVIKARAALAKARGEQGVA